MPGGNGLARRKGGRENMNELDELRLKIAKEKGYTHVIGKMDAASRYPTEYWLVGNSKTSVLPDWTTDIAAAWELVEEIKSDGREVGVTFVRNSYNKFTGWMVDVGPKNGLQHSITVTGATAPEAICSAYLAWKEEQKP
jgi:hypothetical protein